MNKPVAWLMVDRDDGNSYIQMGEPTRDDKVSHHPYPLYTHPVKEPMMVLDGNRVYPVVKELTDGEIEEVIRKHWNREYGNRNMLTLCKAILKEANK